MKWALVVYFMTTSGWQSAETLGKDKMGWSSVVYETYQQCSSRARMFNEDSEHINSIKAVCEKVKS